MLISRRFPKFLVVILVFSVFTTLAAEPSPEVLAAAYLEKSFRSHSAPGRSVAIASKGKIVFSQGYGYADLDSMVPATFSTVFNIGSISKTLTAVAVMQLLQEGKISLSDPIQKYVPAFPDKGSPITIFHLLTHTSGIRHYRDTDFPVRYGIYSENMQPYQSLDEAIKIFKDDPLLFPPGKFYFYTSYGINLLQGVVEKASGMAFEDYMRQHVWIPAGMLATEFDRPERIVPHRAKPYYYDHGQILNFPYSDVTYKFASGGMLSTAEDLVRFGVAINHDQLLKSESTSLMFKSALPPGTMEFREKGAPQRIGASEHPFEQALVWHILQNQGGRRVLTHCGTVKGFGACLLDYPDEDLVLADIANSSDSGGTSELLTIAQFFLEKKQSK